MDGGVRSGRDLRVVSIFPRLRLRLPSWALTSLSPQSFHLLYGRSHHRFHLLFAEQRGKKHAELDRAVSQQLYQLVEIFLAESSPVRHNVQILEVRESPLESRGQPLRLTCTPPETKVLSTLALQLVSVLRRAS